MPPWYSFRPAGQRPENKKDGELRLLIALGAVGRFARGPFAAGRPTSRGKQRVDERWERQGSRSEDFCSWRRQRRKALACCCGMPAPPRLPGGPGWRVVGRSSSSFRIRPVLLGGITRGLSGLGAVVVRLIVPWPNRHVAALTPRPSRSLPGSRVGGDVPWSGSGRV